MAAYEERTCPRCDAGRVYDERAGWVACPNCAGTGRALVFVYPAPKRRRRAGGRS